ncbi:transmembrane protein, putative [Bodo saltans]|uniref:Transmembrane protein, putative n=1 Tax=Bodo saltans TaxID=75058 RepID=A0A0S4IWN6_BODSA|nr:transmembrane protein, putative [Bodo saltans]|eukprot:CUG31101.1 transmembrane protein, putative [Bodo saltans]
MEVEASSAPATRSPFANSSGFLGMFEAIAVVVFGLSLYWMRRRRRQLEVRTEQRYERLSRIEMGSVGVGLGLDPPLELGAAAAAASSPHSAISGGV